MTAFSPFDNKDYDNMSLPYAFYEISMANSGDRDAKVSLRFVFPEYVKTWAVASDCTGEKTIRKGGTATARFVVAWYDHTDPELAHYKNLYASPQPIAKHGLEVFSRLKHNAMRLADGMRSSSLPHWLQNQVANTLSAIVINSMYKRDGRVAFAEGQWTCFGTMDQMWLARHIICQAVPFYAWRELEYWARTQMKNGQIHHDMNLMDVGSEREKRSALVAWDDTEHRDYRDIQKWVDLNCGFIISVYEAYRTTGDRESFLRLWPNMKRAADRIKKQVELLGKTFGIYGYGSIGRQTARIAKAFGMEVLVCTRTVRPEYAADGVEFVDFDTLLARSDVLSLHCPATPETRGLMSREALAKMKPGTILLNTARGALVDEEAVADALESGKLAFYGADAFATEPLPPQSRLRSLPGAVLTPHIAWTTKEALQRLMDITTGNLRSFLAGKGENIVNP